MDRLIEVLRRLAIVIVALAWYHCDIFIGAQENGALAKSA